MRKGTEQLPRHCRFACPGHTDSFAKAGGQRPPKKSWRR
jgi:hypothetical protein